MVNFLSNLFSGGGLSQQSQSVLGIDIGSSSIKVVQISRKNGHAVLETYGELALGPYAGKGIGEATNLSAQKLVEALKDMLKEKEVNITSQLCGVAIPFASSFMTVIEMPVMPQKQLSEMIPLEARKYIPVPISEVVLDWYIIPKDKNPETPLVGMAGIAPETTLPKLEVLVVALHNDTITRYKDMMEKTELVTSFFEIEIFSTMRSILDNEINPILIIDMGATSTKIYIVERGILRSSHMINRGSQNITDELSKSLGISIIDAEFLKREKGLEGEIHGIKTKEVITFTLNYIFSEANHVVLAYQKKYNKNISLVVLVGGGSALKGVLDIAKVNFQTEVITGDPFEKVVAPAFFEKVLKETGPEFTVAVGVALRRLQELD